MAWSLLSRVSASPFVSRVLGLTVSFSLLPQVRATLTSGVMFCGWGTPVGLGGLRDVCRDPGALWEGPLALASWQHPRLWGRVGGLRQAPGAGRFMVLPARPSASCSTPAVSGLRWMSLHRCTLPLTPCFQVERARHRPCLVSCSGVGCRLGPSLNVLFWASLSQSYPPQPSSASWNSHQPSKLGPSKTQGTVGQPSRLGPPNSCPLLSHRPSWSCS